jgi:hypothetical protein
MVPVIGSIVPQVPFATVREQRAETRALDRAQSAEMLVNKW